MKNKLLILMLEDLIRLHKDTKDFKDFYTDAIFFRTIKQAVADNYTICIMVNTAEHIDTFYSESDFRFCFNVLKTDIRVKLKKFELPIHIIKGEDEKRKVPNPFYIYEKAMELDASLRDSILIGDDISTMELAYNAGVGTYIETKELYEA